MNFIKRAMLSVIRKKGKTVILLLIIFILGNVMAYGISINQATKNINNNIKKSLGGYATIELDYTAIENEYNNGNQDIYSEIRYLNVDEIQRIGSSSYVKYYDYSASGYYYLENLKRVTNSESSKWIGSGSLEGISLKGIQYAPIMDASEDRIRIVDGRAFNEAEVNNNSYVTVISKEFALENNLQVGDTVKLLNAVYDWSSDSMVETMFASQDIVLEIIGIYEVNMTYFQKQNNNGNDFDIVEYELEDIYNTIYVPNGVVIEEERFYMEKYSELYPEDVHYYNGENTYYEQMFVLNNPEDIIKFEEEVKGLLPPFNLLKYSADSFDQISASVSQVTDISKAILYGSVIATVIILSLVVVLFLRDRRHEFGIYLALGESRLKLLSQILVEIMSVAVIALSLSVFTGNILAKELSSSMLTKELDKNVVDTGYYRGMSGQYIGEVSNEDVLSAYDIKLGGEYIAMIYLIGIGTVFVSTLAPMAYTLRLKPKKILM